MKVYFFLLLALTLFITHKSYSQDKIRWEKSDELRWKDFKGEFEENSKMAAQTYTRTEFQMSYQDGKFSWNLDCYFSPKESWVKPGLKSDGLLSHEQLHFDIAELNARLTRERLSELNLEGLEDSKKLQTNFELGLQDLAEVQQRYDQETDHGIKIESQKKWEKNVKSELKKNKKYASSNYNFTD